MRIFVTAKPSAKQPKIERLDETHFHIAVREPAREGRANYAIAKVLAYYFEVPTSSVRLISGASAKSKIFEIQI